jgi:phthiocerol/phenolphthiocerol synthesis type-I polyketide synthase E
MFGNNFSVNRSKSSAQIADLVADATLPDDLAPAGAAETSPGEVLVTGATGFLGRFLTAELLERGEVVHALVRSASDGEAAGRVRGALATTGRWDERWDSRLHTVRGDLAEPRLRLPPDAYAALSASVGRVFHCAADVHGASTYASLRQSNVLGTLELLRFCAAGRPKRFLHVSSVAAVPPGDGPLAERSRLGTPIGVEGGYPATKWVVEQLVEESSGRGLAATIFRVGSLGGDTRTGLSNPRDYRWLVIRASAALGEAPLVASRFSWLPVDDAARAIVGLAAGADDGIRRFHLVGANALRWLDVFSWLRRLGYALRSVDAELWRRHVAELPDEIAGIAAVFAGPRRTPAVASEATTSALAARGLPRTPIDEALFRLYVEAGAARRELPPLPTAARR